MNRIEPPAQQSDDVCDTDAQAIEVQRASTLIAEAVAQQVAQQIKQNERDTLTQTLELRDALGRILADDLISEVRVPNHTNSAMDGYAFCAHGALRDARDELRLRIIGEAHAGRPFDHSVGDGECIRILTGAVMPAATDSVVAQERATLDGDCIVVRADEVKCGDNVRNAGEDLAVGDLAIANGTKLTPAHLGLAASLGAAQLRVHNRVRVAYFSTGDELRALGEPLAIGQLYDSNRHTMHAMLTQLGAEGVDLGIVADDRTAIERALIDAQQHADVIISTAGASVGDADYIRQCVAMHGEVLVAKVAIKPGRPFIAARLHNAHLHNGNAAKLFFGLPGNPVSVMVTFAIFVAPAIRQLGGETPRTPLRIHARTTSQLKKRPGRAEYQRGTLCTDNHGELVVRTTGEQGSGILHSMGEANCYIVLPTDSDGAAAGDVVEVEPFEGMLMRRFLL